MKQHIIRILVAIGAVLALVLAWMWFGTDGKLRNVHWQAPQPIHPDFASMVPSLPQQESADLNRFVATLERPLFSPTRRPPPPPPPPVVAPPPPPPDPLAKLQLFGIFSQEGGGGGIIARIDGKLQRVRVQERIGNWVVKSVANRSVTLVSGGTTRVIELVHAKVPAAGAPGDAAAGAATPAAAPPRGTRVPRGRAAERAAAAEAAANPAAAPPAAPSRSREEILAARKIERNAARAKAGLPPLP